MLYITHIADSFYKTIFKYNPNLNPDDLSYRLREASDWRAYSTLLQGVPHHFRFPIFLINTSILNNNSDSLYIDSFNYDL